VDTNDASQERPTVQPLAADRRSLHDVAVRTAVLALVLLSAACGGPSGFPCSGGADCAQRCGPGVDAPPLEGQTHVSVGTKVRYAANPPASGSHYPFWRQPWEMYATQVPREEWVHNLEHGGIVLLYNCPTPCPDVVDALTAIRLGRQPDRFNAIRILGTPDLEMPRRVAAVAWGWRWQGDSVDADAIECFIDARYDRGPESLP
jgi:hypothetical protein